MSTDTPNDPFLPFAHSLLNQLLNSTMSPDAMEALIAQRAADLVATQTESVELFALKILMMIGDVYGEIVRVSDRKAIDLQSDLIDAIEQVCKERTMKGIQHDTTGATSVPANQPQPDA